MAYRIIGFVLALTLIASCAELPEASADATGLYLSESKFEVSFVQIVEAENQNVIARAEYFSIDDKGRLKSNSINFEGVANAEQLILSPKNLLSGIGLMPSLTGELQNGALNLVYEDETVTLRASNMDERRLAIARLTELAGQIEHLIEVEQMSAEFYDTEERIQVIEAELDATSQWLTDATLLFETQLTDARGLSNRISDFVETDDNWQQKNALIDEFYVLEGKLLHTAQEVRERRRQMNGSVAQIQNQIVRVMEFCDHNSIVKSEAEFCSDALIADGRVEAVVSVLKPQFVVWDSIQPN